MIAGNRVRLGGTVCCAAGLLGFAGHGYLAVTVRTDGSGAFGYPEPVAGATALQMALSLVPALLIVGLLALHRSGALPETRRARLGYHGAVAVLAGLTSLQGIAVTVTGSSSRGGPPVFGVVHAGYLALLAGCLLLVGLEVARRGPWVGWHRWLPFTLGAWLVMAVLPASAVGFRAASGVIAGWCALFALLGLVLVRDGHRAGAQQDRPWLRASPSARAAAVLAWVYAAGFGSATIPVTAYLLQTRTLPDFLGLFTMFGGPLRQLPVEAFVLALAAFLLLTLLAGWAAWLVWNGSRTGALLTFALLPVEAAFWIGFSLPLPWITGVARLILVAAAWRSLGGGSGAAGRTAAE